MLRPLVYTHHGPIYLEGPKYGRLDPHERPPNAPRGSGRATGEQAVGSASPRARIVPAMGPGACSPERVKKGLQEVHLARAVCRTRWTPAPRPDATAYPNHAQHPPGDDSTKIVPKPSTTRRVRAGRPSGFPASWNRQRPPSPERRGLLLMASPLCWIKLAKKELAIARNGEDHSFAVWSRCPDLIRSYR